MNIIVGAAATVLAAAMVGVFAQLRSFISEQRKVNEANELSNRSIQRAEIYRMFNRYVESGEAMPPYEMDLLETVYGAYHANGGNGTCTVMYDKLREHARISTEPKEVCK